MGSTLEGRDIMVLNFHLEEGGGAKKPAVWMDCGIHAREWISVATCLYIAYK